MMNGGQTTCIAAVVKERSVESCGPYMVPELEFDNSSSIDFYCFHFLDDVISRCYHKGRIHNEITHTHTKTQRERDIVVGHYLDLYIKNTASSHTKLKISV